MRVVVNVGWAHAGFCQDASPELKRDLCATLVAVKLACELWHIQIYYRESAEFEAVEVVLLQLWYIQENANCETVEPVLQL